jgi:hypothetical protein
MASLEYGQNTVESGHRQNIAFSSRLTESDAVYVATGFVLVLPFLNI